MEYNDAKISALIEGIYDGSITEYDLPIDLYKAIGEYFQKGLYKGFGMDLKDAVGKDLELLTELRENIWMFSAAKTFQEVKDIGAMMYNENEELRSLKEFNDLGREAYSLWNDTWGTTEYNTAEGQAQSASKWNEIEANKKIFPMLTYSAIDDDNTSEECIAMNGVTAPVDDPIWDMNAPLQHFNCRCVLLQQEEGVTLTSDEDKQAIAEKTFEVKNPMFNMNPGKDGYIFKDDHPYFEVEKKDRGFARYNFGLPMPESALKIKVDDLIGETEKYLKANNISDRSIYRDFEASSISSTKTTEELRKEYGSPLKTEFIFGREGEAIPKSLSDEIRYLGKKDVDQKLKDSKTVSINVKDLNVSQQYVFENPLLKSEGKDIFVIEHDGKKYVVDGNHSLSKQVLEGKEKVKAKFIKL